MTGIPNRFYAPLDAVEILAESDRGRLLEIARETRNWHLLHVIQAMRNEEAMQRQEKRRFAIRSASSTPAISPAALPTRGQYRKSA